MAPDITNEEIIVAESESDQSKSPQAEPRQYHIVYRNIAVFLYYHIAGIYGFYLCFGNAMWMTIFWNVLTYIITVLGIAAGSHRLWSHKAYKATKPLQIFLVLAQSVANQHSVAHWVRDHRLHHKYSETDADPHNASRGFFYSHVGWLLVKKHPEVRRRGKTIDMSDIYSNPYLKFQNKHSSWFIPLFSFLIPTYIPTLWGESFTNTWHINMLRYVLNLNVTFCVNSVAHLWDQKPYDKHIAPSQSPIVNMVTLGEGWHNYHHCFPWDYRCDELGLRFNFTTYFIDICEKLGLAYDLKSASEEVIEERAERTGDGTRFKSL
ncbi:hypothetical protein K1T71_014636 [Dendrolimus kikuchii]|uniref:Uncharacterized protein n=1 Tax=Dendrolimus kikuchii TaxID=765133 RepID=A0ACC1CEK6_9NEOP|nr:hypothetical protein K1T71_014636 [Dendrolimus kikuchii]